MLFRFPLLLHRFSRNCNKINCELLVSLSNENIYFAKKKRQIVSLGQATRRSFVRMAFNGKAKNGTNGQTIKKSLHVYDYLEIYTYGRHSYILLTLWNFYDVLRRIGSHNWLLYNKPYICKSISIFFSLFVRTFLPPSSCILSLTRV